MAKDKKRILLTLICQICEKDLEHQLAILTPLGKLRCKECFGQIP